MNCPLARIGHLARKELLTDEYSDCLKEECAWFIGDEDICVLVAILGVLAHLIDTEVKD